MNKKIILLALGFLLLIGAQSIAQTKGQSRILISYALGTQSSISDTGELGMGSGITATGEYYIFDKFALVTSYTFFFESTVNVAGTDYSIDANAFNIDAKYYLLNKAIGIYGLFGVSFASANLRINGLDLETSSNKTGINAGGGIDFRLGKRFVLNAQAKYHAPLEQMVYNAGIGFTFNHGLLDKSND
ncbi:MAG: porin family protein [Cyclobacteriaceae bacterium]|nr:porin family protein [Cyclobacteriaceae bacterium]